LHISGQAAKTYKCRKTMTQQPSLLNSVKHVDLANINYLIEIQLACWAVDSLQFT